MMTSSEPLKSEAELPVPVAWRETFTQIVDRLVLADYGLDDRPLGVAVIAPALAEFIAGQIESYGDELVPLTDDVWDRSISAWVDGYWEVLVDLCTKEQGVSDLVLFADVREQGGGYVFEVASVYVP